MDRNPKILHIISSVADLTQRSQILTIKLMNQNSKQDPRRVWISLFVDILLPVLILNKLSSQFGENGPVYALLLAVSLPLGHGLFNFFKEKKIHWLPFFGLLNVLFTGGFALMKLEGVWFAIKEASFPALIGIFVFFSSFSRKPVFSFFINQPGFFSIEQIQQRLEELNNQENYRALLKKCTLLFSGTFFFSALLNFVLAIRIFKNIPVDLSEMQKVEIRNTQIADMTWMGYVIIALPLMVITTCLFYYCLRNLSKLTGLALNELMNH